MSEPTDAELSRLLFVAREICENYADILDLKIITRVSNGDRVRGVRDQIDAYRAMRGWTPNGFGGE